jgi:hypothetical protein
VNNRPILNGLPFTIATMLGDVQAASHEQRYLITKVIVANHEALGDIGTGKQRHDRKAACSQLAIKQDIALIGHMRVGVFPFL